MIILIVKSHTELLDDFVLTRNYAGHTGDPVEIGMHSSEHRWEPVLLTIAYLATKKIFG